MSALTDNSVSLTGDANARVTASLTDRDGRRVVRLDSNGGATSYSGKSDSTGAFSFDLEPNASITPANSCYTVWVGGNSYLIQKGSGTETIVQCTVADPTSLLPPEIIGGGATPSLPDLNVVGNVSGSTAIATAVPLGSGFTKLAGDIVVNKDTSLRFDTSNAAAVLRKHQRQEDLRRGLVAQLASVLSAGGAPLIVGGVADSIMDGIGSTWNYTDAWFDRFRQFVSAVYNGRAAGPGLVTATALGGARAWSNQHDMTLNVAGLNGWQGKLTANGKYGEDSTAGRPGGGVAQATIAVSLTFQKSGGASAVIKIIRNSDSATTTLATVSTTDGSITNANLVESAHVLSYSNPYAGVACTIHVEQSGAGTVLVDGWDPDYSGVKVWNLAHSATTADAWGPNAGTPVCPNFYDIVRRLTPAAVIMSTGINEKNTGVSLATARTLLASRITECQAASPHTAIFYVFESYGGGTDVATWQTAWRDGYEQTCIDNGVFFVDAFDVLGDLSTAGGNPYTYNDTDGLHPNTKGHAALGRFVADLLVPKGSTVPSIKADGSVPWAADQSFGFHNITGINASTHADGVASDGGISSVVTNVATFQVAATRWFKDITDAQPVAQIWSFAGLPSLSFGAGGSAALDVILQRAGANALVITASAGVTFNGALLMGTNKVTGLAAATTNGDAVRWEQSPLGGGLSGGMPTQAADTVLANATNGSAAPTAVALTASTVVGRRSSGDIVALSYANLLTDIAALPLAGGTLTGALTSTNGNVTIGDGTNSDGGVTVVVSNIATFQSAVLKIFKSLADAQPTVQIQSFAGVSSFSLGAGGSTAVDVTYGRASAHLASIDASSGVALNGPLALGTNKITGISAPSATGDGARYDGLPRMLFNHIADQGVGADTTEDTLYTDTIAAVPNNGDMITAVYGGTLDSNATGTKRIRLYVGAVAIFDTTALAGTAAGSWNIEATIVRESATVVRCTVAFNATGFSAANVATVAATYTRVTGITSGPTYALKLTGTNATTATANRIVASVGEIWYFPAAL